MTAGANWPGCRTWTGSLSRRPGPSGPERRGPRQPWRFDLAAMRQDDHVTLLYTSDVGVQWAGWWADDFVVSRRGNHTVLR